MKNKNALYIVLGIGAGVVAYYLFCKKKNNEALTEVKSDEKSEKPATSKAVAGVGGGGFTPVMPKYVTPVATTTPLVVNVTSTPSTPTTTPTATAVTPSKVDVALVSSPVSVSTSTATTRPVLASEVVEKPITTPITTPTTTTTTTATATELKRSSFEGVGQQCFEVGECLYDL
jgi:hypothetical protein